jgi:hypothetical protein
MTTRITFRDVLFGSLVALLGFPLAAGPIAGGWLAGRRSDRPVAGSLAAGLMGGVPWAVLCYLAMAGAVPQWGYHDGWVHVGVNPAAPGTFSALTAGAVGVAVLLMAVLGAVAGGVLAWMRPATTPAVA